MKNMLLWLTLDKKHKRVYNKTKFASKPFWLSCKFVSQKLSSGEGLFKCFYFPHIKMWKVLVKLVSLGLFKPKNTSIEQLSRGGCCTKFASTISQPSLNAKDLRSLINFIIWAEISWENSGVKKNLTISDFCFV
jgi:hypothetical protein